MPTTTAERQRRWKERRRKEGKKQLTVLLSEEAYQKLAELKDRTEEKNLSAAIEQLILPAPAPQKPLVTSNKIPDRITLEDLKIADFRNALAAYHAAGYIARDLDGYGFSEIDNWHTDDQDYWEDILDDWLYPKMIWQDQEDPDAREERAYNQALKSLAQGVMAELKNRQTRCRQALKELESELTKNPLTARF